MPFNGTGTFTPDTDYGAETPPIDIDLLDDTLTDISEGLSNCITRDGQGKPSADIDWNAKKLTNLATPTSDSHAATKGYVDGLALPSASSFAVSWSGFSGLVATTFYYTKVGKLVTLTWQGDSTGGSNDTNFLATAAVPADLRPAIQFTFQVSVWNGGVPEAGAQMALSATGTLQLARQTGAWSASGIKGLRANTVTYFVA